jgi:hypothetical protein
MNYPNDQTGGGLIADSWPLTANFSPLAPNPSPLP